MRLAQFIAQAHEAIIAESISYAARIPALSSAPAEVVRDHLPLVLDTIVRDLETSQTRAQSIEKSLGDAPSLLEETAAQTHGTLRARSGLDIEQLVAEYRVLRSCVLRLWADGHDPDRHVIEDTLRFNEAIDQAIAESVAFHAAEIRRWRDIFLAVLGHDLRNPLSAITLTSELLTRETSGAALNHAVSVLRNSRRLAVLLDSLLEYNKSALGVGMEITRETVDLGAQCQEEIQMLRSAFPQRQIAYEAAGDTLGVFDGSRVREALANLVSNAAQHSPEGTPISVRVKGNGKTVEIATDNLGDPIPIDVLETLFEPLRRRELEGDAVSRNLGLGLFIVRAIARAHEGDVVASTSGGHIHFTMTLPKAAKAA